MENIFFLTHINSNVSATRGVRNCFIQVYLWFTSLSKLLRNEKVLYAYFFCCWKYVGALVVSGKLSSLINFFLLLSVLCSKKLTYYFIFVIILPWNLDTDLYFFLCFLGQWYKCNPCVKNLEKVEVCAFLFNYPWKREGVRHL